MLELTDALRRKAAALSQAGPRAWTARDVEHALFAAAVRAGARGGGKAVSGSGKAASGSSKKRALSSPNDTP